MSDSGKGGSGESRRFVLYLGLVCLAVAALGIQWIMNRESGVTWTQAPAETHGIWTTTDARYGGRAIEVGPDNVNLRVDEGGTQVPGRLTIAREFFDNDQRVLRLEYQTQSGPDALEMVVREPGTMVLRNQPDIVWRADPNTMLPPPAPTVRIDPVGGPFGLGFGTIALMLGLVAAGGGAITLLRTHGGGGSEPSVATGGKAPNLIRGVWTTPDPRHEGRSIRIANNYAFAHFGPGPVRVGGLIDTVIQGREDGERLVTMTYNRPDGPEALEMLIDKSGHMRLRGGRSVWVRRAS